MRSLQGLRRALPFAASLALAACSGGGDGTGAPQPATLTVSLMDAPVDDVEAVHVEITAIWLKSAADEDGPAVSLPLDNAPISVNLLELTHENAAILVDGAAIEAGAYEWLAMDVNADIDNELDSYVVTTTGEWREIFVPSGRVRLVEGFEVSANEAVELLFDWDMRSGLVAPPGLGGYLLKPAFRVIDVTQYGTLSGSIAVDTVLLEENDCNADTDTGNYDVGNAVYVFAGHGVSPDDIDGIDPEPIATADAELNDASTHYEYRALLSFGDYTVAFTCQAANDLAESDETGRADPMLDTVAFLGAAADITVGAPGNVDVVTDF